MTYEYISEEPGDSDYWRQAKKQELAERWMKWRRGLKWKSKINSLKSKLSRLGSEGADFSDYRDSVRLQNAIWESIKNHDKRRSAYFPLRPRTRRSSFPDATLVRDRTPLLAPLRSDCHRALIRNLIWLWFCFVFMTRESLCLNIYNGLLHLLL